MMSSAPLSPAPALLLLLLLFLWGAQRWRMSC